MTNENKIVIIPSYEPPRAFVDYVNSLISKGIGGVVVVNDGSCEKYSEVYSALKLIEGCTVLEYPENHGKGYALKTAFEYCRENFSEEYVFVTADCDGQHLPDDVIKVADKARTHPGRLILGARDFTSPNVPARSRSGNIQTRRAFKFLYRISLSDTQTGLRAFSYDLLDFLLSISGTRFEYEMNMLIQFHKAHIDIMEVPIETVYNEKSDDVERLSHFRTFSDSVRVFSTLFKNLGWYMLSSVLSAVTDVVAFFVLFSFVFDTQSPAVATLLSTVIARVVSSVINFTFNFKFVFNGQSRKAVFKYYCLWTLQLGASFGLATVWNTAFNGVPILVTLFKGLSDLVLALFSYQIQNRWVFVSRERSRLHFWGTMTRFTKGVINPFMPDYRCFVYADDKKPCVYVCRHLNLHGPITMVRSLGFSVHMFVLNYFVSFKKCYRQYSTYTFSARNGKKPNLWIKIKSFFASLYVVPLVKSTKPVTVYRGGSDSLVTFRQAMKYLSNGENLMVFPDIEYTADENKKSDIYSGFLFIDKLYHSKFGEHLNFVAVTVDDTRLTVEEAGTVRFDDNSSFDEQLPEVTEKLRALLMKE